MGMMRVFLFALLLALPPGLAGCLGNGGWHTVRGSGNVLHEERKVAEFDHVFVSGAGELRISQGEEEALNIEADDNLLPFIRSEVHNGELSLGPENVNVRPTGNIVYHLRLKNLNTLHLSGSAEAKLEAIKTDRLELGISVSGSVQIPHLDAQSLSAHITGSGNASAAGRVHRQDIHITGSGSYQGTELESAQAEARITGSGDASLWVTDALSAQITGSGCVKYRGDAHVESHVTGSGHMQKQP